MSAEEFQRARDVLAKWREKASPGPWEVNEPMGELNRLLGWVSIDTSDDVEDPRNVTYEIPRWETPLIVGTAGNPALLDAIDVLLAEAIRVQEFYPTAPRVKDTLPLAAAIIAADDRMSR